MRFDVLTLFPEMVQTVTEFGVVQRAHQSGLIELGLWNPRDYTTDRHRTVDDRPYGGGPGMVMMYEPLAAALAAAKQASESEAQVICMSPQGKPVKQAMINQLATTGQVILVSGRYEGIDERFINDCVDEEWSFGDFVISGGELPAMAVIDGTTRQLPGVLGHSESAAQDSFSDGLLDCPHYTRPETVAGKEVPKVLLSGDHARIAEWRAEQALDRTRKRRPDLLEE